MDHSLSQSTKKWIALGVALLAVVVGIVAFALQPKSPNKDSRLPGAIIELSDTGFLPSTISVKVGTRVQWRNSTDSDHKLVANSETVNAGMPAEVNIVAHNTYSVNFGKEGTYNFYDGSHPTFNDVVIVTQ